MVLAVPSKPPKPRDTARAHSWGDGPSLVARSSGSELLQCLGARRAPAVAAGLTPGPRERDREGQGCAQGQAGCRGLQVQPELRASV